MENRPTASTVGRRFLWYHFPLILYAILVIGVSSVRNLRGPHVDFIALDKLAHFVEYALFALLTWRSFSNLSSRLSANTALLLSLLFLAVFALIDEYFQSFIPGRHADAADWATDILGAFLVLALLWIRRRRKAAAGRS